jgi:ribosomal protein S18 acetylase RimI-like enzyme
VTHDNIVIQHGLPADQRLRAGELLYEAFARKFDAFMDRTRGSRALAQLVNPACVIVALDGDRLVGLAGLYLGSDRRLVRWWPRTYIAELGLWRGLQAAFWMRFYTRRVIPGRLTMDTLAVTADYRGRGIGSRLLAAVDDYARQHGYTSIRLDVADTNPRARQLYERTGFVPLEDHHLPPGALDYVGFSGYTTLIRPVEPAE